MDTYIQLAYRLSSKVILNTYTYFSYFLAVFTFLFETFPVNVLTILAIGIFVVWSIFKKAESNKFSIQVWKVRREEMEGLMLRLQDALTKLQKKIEVTNKKTSNALKTKYDYRIVKDLEQQRKNNNKELKLIQKELLEIQKYAQQKDSILKEQETLLVQLETIAFCLNKYLKVKGKIASFFDKNIRSRIESQLFRVYCIMI